MFRRTLSLAVAALKFEIDRWRHPAQVHAPPPLESVELDEPVVTVAPAPPAPAPNRWASPAFHTATLASTACPDCGEAKKVSWYRCGPCTTVARKAAGYAS